MIVIIINSIEGCCVIVYYGVVIGEMIIGVNIFCDLFVGIWDIVGGCLGVYEFVLVEVCEIVLFEMQQCV